CTTSRFANGARTSARTPARANTRPTSSPSRRTRERATRVCRGAQSAREGARGRPVARLLVRGRVRAARSARTCRRGQILEPLDLVWQAHHSMVIENVSDFTHAWLHRRYRPFGDARLTRLESTDDRVRLAYETKIGMGRMSRLFVDRRRVDTSAIELCYEYPYQWSSTDDKIKHWCFPLPIDERTTRVFFLFYFKSLKIPLTPKPIP